MYINIYIKGNMGMFICILVYINVYLCIRGYFSEFIYKLIYKQVYVLTCMCNNVLSIIRYQKRKSIKVQT